MKSSPNIITIFLWALGLYFLWELLFKKDTTNQQQSNQINETFNTNGYQENPLSRNPCQSYPLMNCWSNTTNQYPYPSGSISNLAKAVLPNTTPNVQITPTVPIVLPISEQPYYVKRKEGVIECTSDLECNFPQKCCQGKCKNRIMIDQVLPNGNLLSPQRIGICPPEQTNHPCLNDSSCQSQYLCCGVKDANRCQAMPTYFYGGFEGNYLDSKCQKVKDQNYCRPK